MSIRRLRFLMYLVPVFWSFLKDLVWEELSVEEIRMNYLFGKANAYERARFLRRAAAIYGEILRRNPTSVPVLLNLGGLYYRRGMYERAIPFYEKVIRINPNHYQGHFWLAMCYMNQRRYYAAINTLEEVIGCLPTFKDALNLLGTCYEKIGEAAKAEHYYLKAISVDPRGIVIHRGLLEEGEKDRRKAERVIH